MQRIEKLLQSLPALYSTENETAETLTLKFRIYIPHSNSQMFWVPTEYCPETKVVFGGAFMFHDVGIELGYSSLDEYKQLINEYGAIIDDNFKPTTLQELKSSLKEIA